MYNISMVCIKCPLLPLHMLYYEGQTLNATHVHVYVRNVRAHPKSVCHDLSFIDCLLTCYIMAVAATQYAGLHNVTERFSYLLFASSSCLKSSSGMEVSTGYLQSPCVVPTQMLSSGTAPDLQYMTACIGIGVNVAMQQSSCSQLLVGMVVHDTM